MDGKKAARLGVWLLLIAALVGVTAWKFSDPIGYFLSRWGVLPSRTVVDVQRQYGPAMVREFRPLCAAAQIPWPPKRLQLLAFKKERVLEVWAEDAAHKARLARYPILALSGGAGPKRKEGDRQVPEGFYHVSELNPNSRYHLSMKVDYPNAEDVKNSKIARNQMGGEIFIHGKNVSIGCLAIGDAAIEKLFCLASLVPAAQRNILIAPQDFRKDWMPAGVNEEAWVQKLYDRLREALKRY